ncbi:MAG: hypothetical protein A2Y25_05210 [Candidatus Melainabacteria bacterium GWF2_37_15]|nr:MAG: hypothetical protein A2Y25_05210 [Candidatus Melainabacteria bacterium GWF2_37_15]
MNEKLVSIAMATYNGEQYLREQLDSIYNQTYKNIEIIVCDDCSSDKTVEILEEYKQKYGLKHFINEKNLGFIKNFEKAASLCNGEYIAFSDQDDIWMSEKIQVLLDELGENTMIHSDAIPVDAEKNIIAESAKVHYKVKKFVYPPEAHNRYINWITCVQGCTALCKREILHYALPIPNFTESHDFWFGFIASKMNGIKYLDKPLIYWRIHGKNTTNPSRLSHKIYMLFGTHILRTYRFIKRLYFLKQRGLEWK